MNRTRQRGFTLIELMVALLVSSLLVGMILAIFSRISLAYRGQQQIAGVQQILAAARAAIELDAKQAGLGMPQGFKLGKTGTTVQSPVRVINSSSGPDQIAFFYIDPSAQLLVNSDSAALKAGKVTVDGVTPTIPSPFAVGDVVVLTTSSTAANPLAGTNPDIATYDACVLRVASVTVNTAPTPSQYTFDTVAPWGSANEGHCGSPNPTVVPNRTMMYRFVAHAYRIDTADPKVGMLERSSTGNLTDTEVWDELAYGFSDLQTAVRIYDPIAVDLDGDKDDHYNWFSSSNLGPDQLGGGATVLGMSISLVAHTDRNVEGIASGATPNLLGSPSDHNSLGDHGSLVLPVAPPDDALNPGQRIYRYSTFQVDFRNLGVGLSP